MIPNAPGPAREAAILDAIKAGDFEHEWHPIRSDARGYTATIYVSADAIKIDGVRIACGAATLQRIADLIGGSLQTTRVVDLAYDQAMVRVEPKLQTPDARMAEWSRVEQHSRAVDADVQGRNGLIRNVGKCWVLSEQLKQRPHAACNYGWHSAKATHTSWSGERLWQPLGSAHDDAHVDYSQTATLMRNVVTVNGDDVPLETVETDAQLSWLVNDSGVMTTRRMPGVSMDNQTTSGVEVKPEFKPIGELELMAVLRDGHHAALGEFPSPKRLGVGWSQVMLETGRGQKCRNCNLGNMTAGSKWQGDYFWLKVPPPDPPTLKFRCYPHWLDGAQDYWEHISRRCAYALPFFDAGEPIHAAAQLKKAGYFTADLTKYGLGMDGLYREFVREILPFL